MASNTWLGIDNPFLVELDSGFKIHQHVADDWNALQQAASNDGIDCQLVSSFRDFHRQLAIWNRKWRGEATLYDANGEQLDAASLSDDEKIDAILTWSALPGGSRHHWGTDIDVYDKHSIEQCGHQFELVDSEYREGGPCYSLAQWLNARAADFRFQRPFQHYHGGVAVELWHLSHIPTALAFEAERNQYALADVLAQADMEGKHAVLNRLDELFHCYVLNKGKQ